MTYSLDEFDSLLNQAQPVDESIPASILRRWRVELVRASVFVSYAIGVLSLDIEMLNRAIVSTNEDVIQALVDDLPGILTSGWVGGGWSLSPDASVSVGAASELAVDQAQNLLGLHGELATSDLGDPDVVNDLLIQANHQLHLLTIMRERLENRIRQIQKIIRRQYALGTASIDDWLT